VRASRELRAKVNYICWALSAAALIADRCRRRDSVEILQLHVPLSSPGSEGTGLIANSLRSDFESILLSIRT